MQAQDILSKRPSQLFPGTQAEIKSRFRELAGQWHPDHCKHPQAAEVFQYVLKCRDAALRGEEELKTVVFSRVRPSVGQKPQFQLAYLHSATIECGQVYVSYDNVSYLVQPSYEPFCTQALNMKWSFPDRKVEQEMTKYLPRSNRWEQCTQGTLMVYRRNSDQILLSDLLEWERKANGAVDHRHVMWMISSMLNFCCYLEIQKVAHLGLLPHYLLASPDLHAVALTGPPLYATPFGRRPKAVPAKVLELFPRLRAPDVVVENSRIDLMLVRALAMEALGHTNPAVLARTADLPAGLRQWLTSPAPTSAITDYKAWEAARGTRKFTPYGTTANEMYVTLAA